MIGRILLAELAEVSIIGAASFFMGRRHQKQAHAAPYTDHLKDVATVALPVIGAASLLTPDKRMMALGSTFYFFAYEAGRIKGSREVKAEQLKTLQHKK